MLAGTLDADAALERVAPTARSAGAAGHRTVLTGLVTGIDTVPAGAGHVTLIDARGQGSGTMRWGRDGSFRLTAPRGGTYTLLVTAPGRGPVARRLALDPGVRRVDVHLQPTEPAAHDLPAPVPARA